MPTAKARIRRPEIVCPKCAGTGRVRLGGHAHAATLKLLADQGREVSGVELARVAGCKPAAMCNRLTYLESLGLVAGRRVGRQRLWSVAREMPSP